MFCIFSRKVESVSTIKIQFEKSGTSHENRKQIILASYVGMSYIYAQLMDLFVPKIYKAQLGIERN